MTDTSQFVPSVTLGGAGRSGAEDDAETIGRRVRLITTRNPYMSDRPDVLLQMAQSPLSTGDLITQSGQMYGMMAADTFATRLRSMSPGQQRAVWATLPKSQQMALNQMQYEPPKTKEESWLGKALGPIDEIAAAGLHGVGDVVSPVVTPALKGLTWIGDRPAHIYRTIRLMDDGSQWAGLAGALIGGIAIAAAPFTAGASLGTLATLGAIGLGATAGAGAAAAISNPGDWARAFGDAYHGEKAFDRPSREKADALLGDPRLVGLAQDLAELDDFNIGDLARELAGQRTVNTNTMFGKITEIASRFGGEGTAEYQQAVKAMTNTLQDPTFLEAVTALQQGKISIGRDVADTVGLAPDSALHSVVSGVLDAAWTVAVDPLLMGGAVADWNRARRLGVNLVEGAPAAEAFLRAAADPRRVRFDTEFLKGFNGNDLQRIATVTPEMMREVPALDQYRRTLAAFSELGEEGLSRPQLLAYFTGSTNLAPLLRGVGTARGARGLELAGLSRRSALFRNLGNEARTFVGALSDPKLEKRIGELIKDAAEKGDADVAESLGTIADNLIDTDTGKIYGSHQFAATLGRGAGRIPGMARVGGVLTSMTTMIPTGKAIALVGEKAPQDVRALAELGRYMGMPSWARRTWANTILFSDNVETRMNAVHGWLDNAMTIAGGRQNRELADRLDQYLARSMQTYSTGEDLIVNGRAMKAGLFLNDQADHIVMPSLNELRSAAATGQTLKLLGLDATAAIDSKLSKIWKPAVLLRIGFIPRAAGEEMVNFMFRGGFGGLVQEFGSRTLAERKLYEALQLGDVTALERVRSAFEDPALFHQAEELYHTLGPEMLLPTHIRPVARMLAGHDWAEPVVNVLDHYGRWIGGMLEKGLPGVRTLEDPLTATVKGIARGTETGPLANLSTNAESILFGNPRSWRRMMLGGVNDDLVDASIAFQGAYADSLMRRVGTTSAGVWDPGNDPASYQRRLTVKDGKIEEEPVIVLRGQPAVYSSNQWEYAHGVHYQAVHPMQDPIGAHLAREYLPRMRGGTSIADDQLDVIFDAASKVNTDIGKRIMHEFLGADDADQVRVMVRELNKLSPELSSHLATYLPKHGEITLDQVIDGVRGMRTVNEGTHFADVYDELLGELDQIKALHATVTSLDTPSRAFAAANVRSAGFDRDGGLAERWQTYRGAGGDSPFVDNWSDLHDEMLADVRNRIQHTLNQEKASHSQRLADLPNGDPLKDGTVLAWRAPSLHNFRSVEDVARAAPNPGIVERNRDLVERLISEPDGRIGLLADRALAEQLAAVTTTPVRAHTLPRRVQSGRIEFDGGLVPAARETVDGADHAVMWSADGTMFPESAASSYPELDERAQEWAEQMLGRTRQVWTQGTVQKTTARGRKMVDEAGNEIEIPLLYEQNPMLPRGQQLEPIEPGAEIDPDRVYFTRKGKRVHASEPNYTTMQTLSEGDGAVMWPLVGPMIEDSIDAQQGLVRFRPKDSVMFGREGDIIPSGDVVPVYRSRPQHVHDAGGLPSHATLPKIATVNQSWFEGVVRYGFDKVLGPAIDRIARQPMALHFFAQRYQYSRTLQRALEDPEAIAALDRVAGLVSARSATMEVEDLLDDARLVAVADGAKGAERWTQAQTAAWMRGHDPQELSDLLTGVISRPTTTAGTHEAVGRLRAMDPEDVITTLGARMPSGDDLLAYVRARIPADDLSSLEKFNRSDRARRIRETDPYLAQLSSDDWNAIVGASRTRNEANRLAGEYAATAAINDMLPFLDSHEYKTQFAEATRAFLPFHYAEENFVKRWARTFADQGPLSTARKMQLGYAGLRTGGVVRSDAQGNDYFVMPGSQLLIDAVSKIFPNAGVLPVGAMFQMSTKSLLPGVNEQFGSPSFSPMVSVPLGITEKFFPEVNSVQRALLGDYASTRGVVQQLIPAHFQRLFEAVSGDENSSTRYSSAMLTTIAQLESNPETALPDGATPGQVDEYMRKVRAHTRIIMFAQAAAGFVAPASPNLVNTGSSGDGMAGWTGLGIDDPRNVLSDLYQKSIRALGIEEGTKEFLELYPMANLEDISNPLALVQGLSKSTSGAPLPATAEAVSFYDSNQPYMQEFPDASPWLLPPANGNARDQYAYDQQTINGLRQRQSPEDFLTSIKFKEAAGPYFTARQQYLDAVSRGEQANDEQAVNAANAQWSVFSTTWKAAHPLFASELESGEGRARRKRVIEQMRTIVNDPGAPESPQLEGLRTAMQEYDNYQLRLAIMADDRSAVGRARTEKLKLLYQRHMSALTSQTPGMSQFWASVLQPESSLD